MSTTFKPLPRPPIKQSDRLAFETELARCVVNEAECKRNWDTMDHDAGAWQGITDWCMESAVIRTDGHI